MIRAGAFVVLATAAGVVQAASVTDTPATEVFVQTCMAHHFNPAELYEQMRRAHALVLEGEAAATFLTGLPGKAWSVEEAGTHLVVAQRNDGVCAVFAKRAEVAKVEAAFAALVGRPPAPIVATQMDGASFGPVDDQLRTVAWGWGASGQIPGLVFALTTSRADDPTVAAMISLASARRRSAPGTEPASAAEVTP